MEFQLQKDETIALRVFEYCFEEAKKTKDEKENEIILHFAKTKVIYLQANKHIPENYIIRFQMPNGEEFCYEVPVIQLLSKGIPEIVEEKFTTYMEDIEQKIIKKATGQGIKQGMAQGMKITYLITKNPGLSDEEISSQTVNDIETIHKTRKELMELI